MPVDRGVYAAPVCELSVKEAMVRLSDIASDPLPFQGPGAITAEDMMRASGHTADLEYIQRIQAGRARCYEFDCLSAIVAHHDAGGLARLKAIHRLMQAYAEIGGDPLELQNQRPREPATFRADQMLAGYLTSYDLSEESAQFLETAFKSELERIINDPGTGVTRRNRSFDGPLIRKRIYGTLLKTILNSGFASQSLAEKVRDRFVRDQEEHFFDLDYDGILRIHDLKLIANTSSL
ncbi:MAG: hypothetical protein IID37_10920, partial [Planctomycetes bacterium]|nr:hypothetical protein [Planctomycetota bacterium]